MFRKAFTPFAILILALAGICAERVEAQLRPSSAVLLPYFEVDLGGSGKTTMFAVGNILSQPVDVVIEVRTNWGIVVSSIPLTLQAHEVKSFNLRDWIVQGKLPNKTLKQAEKARLKAVLSGLASPADKLFYSTAVAPNLAVGSVVVKAQGVLTAGALWGDFLLVDSANNVSKGDDLVNLDKSTSCPGSGLCSHHALRYLTGAAIDADTQVIIWTDRSVQPSKSAYPESQKVAVDGIAYNEAGKEIGSVDLRLLPLQVISVESLKLLEPFGWLDLTSEEPTFIGIHFDSAHRDGAALQAYCLKDPPPPPPTPPGIQIHKRTNGQDAETAPGPKIAVGSAVRWDYIVTNTGTVRLTNVTVDDDQGVNVSCPKTALDPGESMTCSGSGTAVACQYVNIGTATGKPPSGPDVTAADPSHYFGSQNPKIAIKTAVNGQDADTAPGPTIPAGSAVTWTYAVTNTGDVNLTDVKVTDSKGVAVSCPKTSLHPGEAMTCTASGTAISGNYENVGAVTAKSPCDEAVQDSDPSHYTNPPTTPKLPEITIKKYTNGDDANAAPGPMIEVGKPVTWTYTVTNSGPVPLGNVVVADNRGVAVSCPKSTLAVGEAMTCTGNGTATAGQYENIGTATGKDASGNSATASDPSHYFGCAVEPPTCGIKIKKYTNGEDADTAPGPTIPVGNAVHWTYVVTNMGQVALSNVRVTDNRGVAVSCPKTTLQPGEAMTCTGNGTATAGQYENIGTAVGTPPSGPDATASDPSHYYGQPPQTGGQGCTPGYWKNHTGSWPPTGYSPSQTVQSAFSQAAGFPSLGNASLLDGLSFQGGSTLQGGAEILLRASIAALLNAAHSNVSYPRTPAGVISDVNSALASGNRDTMITLASQLDRDNNLGCPLN